MRATTLGVLLLVAIGIGMACGGSRQSWEWRQDKKNDITSLFSQIGNFRVEAGMAPEPALQEFHQIGPKTVAQLKAVCPSNPPVNEACADVCTLAEHICDNAEAICDIATDLRGDKWADEKCASAKASCREAKKKCCTKCSQAKSTPVW